MALTMRSLPMLDSDRPSRRACCSNQRCSSGSSRMNTGLLLSTPRGARESGALATDMSDILCKIGL